MSKHLVVVESPTKAKTIKKYLGADFNVLASYGHVRDLLPKSGAVDTENNFAMNYQIVEKSAKYVESIVKAMKKAETLYLATDLDREGEAISWHLCEILKQENVLENKAIHRMVFHEITERTIQESITHPRQLSMDLVNAQQARRALDFLVGFNLSPLLWQKIRFGLSAGRVQSPALRLIVEREEEIEKFKPREYWTIESDLKKDSYNFIAKLDKFEGKKITQFSIANKDSANHIKIVLLKEAGGFLKVSKVDKKQRKRQPSAPFITSTLQQESARKLGFTTKRTMDIAQKLYEGIDIGSGVEGLITYMRTDSVNIATEALSDIRFAISERYGLENLPKNPNEYKTKSKNAQEAHEAIRPTKATRYPDEIANYLTPDQLKLYTLIWQRTIASQMIHATLDTVAVDFACGEGNSFKATGSTIVNPGFMSVYQEDEDDKKANGEEGKMLPILKEGEVVQLKNIFANQHFTEPPPRFTEASLVKNLEEFGIGRPSTYAAIISTLQQREYVTLDKKRFKPTDVGRVVNKFLTQHFTQYVDYDFTAKLEDELDAVSRGEEQWIPLLEKFWGTFKELVDEKTKTVQRKDVTHEHLNESCPKCGRELLIRLGKRGRFVGCSGYPSCTYTRGLEIEVTVGAEPEIISGRFCPECQASLCIKHGRYGKFIGCSNYPKCKYIEQSERVNTGIQCPTCGKGNLVKKRSRFGVFFYSCSSYPICKYALPNEPIKEKCPNCQWPILMVKITKRRGAEKVCPQRGCNYSEPIKIEDIEEGE